MKPSEKIEPSAVLLLLPLQQEISVEALASTFSWEEPKLFSYLRFWEMEKKIHFKQLTPTTIIIAKYGEEFKPMAALPEKQKLPPPQLPIRYSPPDPTPSFSLTLPEQILKPTTETKPPFKTKCANFFLILVALSISAVDITINWYFGTHKAPDVISAILVTIGGTGFDLGKTFLLPRAIYCFRSLNLLRGFLIFFGWLLCLAYGILICWNFAAHNLATKVSSNAQVVQNIETKKNELQELEKKLKIFSEEKDQAKIRSNEKLVSSWTSRRSALSLEIRNEEKFLTSSNPSAELTASNFNWLIRKEMFDIHSIENSQLWLFVLLINLLPSIILLSKLPKKEA